MVNSTIWNAFPWQWTLGTLTAIPLVDGTQDYSLNAANSTDFLRPVNIWITRTDLTPDDYCELKVVQHLPPELTTKAGWPSFRTISYELSLSKLRLEFPPSVSGAVVMQIDGDYQKVPTKITATATVLVQPDRYFNVFFEGILYYLYKFSDDSRAGSMVINRHGEKQYTGQLGVWMDALMMMRETEDTRDGDPLMFPNEPLVPPCGSSSGTAVYG